MKVKNKLMRHLRPFMVLLAVLAYSFTYAGSISLADLKDTKVQIGIKEGKIIEIMNEISSNTDYFFIYEDGIKAELNQKVKIENGENLHDLLREISNKSKLEFRAVNNNIVVRKRSADQSNSQNVNNLQ